MPTSACQHDQNQPAPHLQCILHLPLEHICTDQQWLFNGFKDDSIAIVNHECQHIYKWEIASKLNWTNSKYILCLPYLLFLIIHYNWIKTVKSEHINLKLSLHNNIRFEAFTVTEYNEVFSDYQLCENGVHIKCFWHCLYLNYLD
jgi:hypothetical protein